MNTEQFKVRYQISGFEAAPAEKNIVFVSDSTGRRTGYFPVFSAQQLMTAAKSYLSDLGETTEDIR